MSCLCSDVAIRIPARQPGPATSEGLAPAVYVSFAIKCGYDRVKELYTFFTKLTAPCGFAGEAR
jgi:hypothetical protein